MLNPRARLFAVEGQEFGIMWQDFCTFKRLNVYQNDKRIGFRDLPIAVDDGDRTVHYLIKRMICGPSSQKKQTK